jgi:hypothetical protein
LFEVDYNDEGSSIHGTRLTVPSGTFVIRRAPGEICQIGSILVVMPVLSRPMVHKLPQVFPIEERLSAREVETSRPNKRVAEVAGPVHSLIGELDLFATNNHATNVITPVETDVEAYVACRHRHRESW